MLLDLRSPLCRLTHHCCCCDSHSHMIIMVSSALIWTFGIKEKGRIRGKNTHTQKVAWEEQQPNSHTNLLLGRFGKPCESPSV